MDTQGAHAAPQADEAAMFTSVDLMEADLFIWAVFSERNANNLLWHADIQLDTGSEANLIPQQVFKQL